MSKSPGATKSVSTTGIPDFQLPYVEEMFRRAKEQQEGPPTFFPGSTMPTYEMGPEETGSRYLTAPERAAGNYLIGQAPKMAEAGESMLSNLQGIAGAGDVSKNPLLSPALNTYNWGMASFNPENVPYMKPSLDTLKYGMKSYDIAQNPYVQRMAESAIRPVFQQLREEALPEIRGGATSSGQYGGTRQSLGEALATERATRAALDATSNIYGRAYETGLGASLNAANQYGNLYQSGMGTALQSAGALGNLLQQGQSTALQAASQIPAAQAAMAMPGAVLSGVGAQERAMDQAKINEEMARHEYNQMAPRTALAEYAKLVGIPIGGTTVSEAQSAAPGKASQIAGLGLSLLPYLGKLFRWW